MERNEIRLTNYKGLETSRVFFDSEDCICIRLDGVLGGPTYKAEGAAQLRDWLNEHVPVAKNIVVLAVEKLVKENDEFKNAKLETDKSLNFQSDIIKGLMKEIEELKKPRFYFELQWFDGKGTDSRQFESRLEVISEVKETYPSAFTTDVIDNDDLFYVNSGESPNVIIGTITRK